MRFEKPQNIYNWSFNCSRLRRRTWNNKNVRTRVKTSKPTLQQISVLNRRTHRGRKFLRLVRFNNRRLSKETCNFCLSCPQSLAYVASSFMLNYVFFKSRTRKTNSFCLVLYWHWRKRSAWSQVRQNCNTIQSQVYLWTGSTYHLG